LPYLLASSFLPLSLLIIWQIVKELNKYHRRERDRLLNQMDGLLDRIQYGRAPFPDPPAIAVAPEAEEEVVLPEWAPL
jgi:hypothetical protein